MSSTDCPVNEEEQKARRAESCPKTGPLRYSSDALRSTHKSNQDRRERILRKRTKAPPVVPPPPPPQQRELGSDWHQILQERVSPVRAHPAPLSDTGAVCGVMRPSSPIPDSDDDWPDPDAEDSDADPGEDADAERRWDTDGNAYTYDEFEAYYHDGGAQWHSASISRPASHADVAAVTTGPAPAIALRRPPGLRANTRCDSHSVADRTLAAPVMSPPVVPQPPPPASSPLLLTPLASAPITATPHRQAGHGAKARRAARRAELRQNVSASATSQPSAPPPLEPAKSVIATLDTPPSPESAAAPIAQPPAELPAAAPIAQPPAESPGAAPIAQPPVELPAMGPIGSTAQVACLRQQLQTPGERPFDFEKLWYPEPRDQSGLRSPDDPPPRHSFPPRREHTSVDEQILDLRQSFETFVAASCSTETPAESSVESPTEPPAEPLDEPPPYALGTELLYVGEAKEFPNKDTVTPGRKGQVKGFAMRTDGTRGIRMSFPGNASTVLCRLDELKPVETAEKEDASISAPPEEPSPVPPTEHSAVPPPSRYDACHDEVPPSSIYCACDNEEFLHPSSCDPRDDEAPPVAPASTLSPLAPPFEPLPVERTKPTLPAETPPSPPSSGPQPEPDHSLPAAIAPSCSGTTTQQEEEDYESTTPAAMPDCESTTPAAMPPSSPSPGPPPKPDYSLPAVAHVHSDAPAIDPVVVQSATAAACLSAPSLRDVRNAMHRWRRHLSECRLQASRRDVQNALQKWRRHLVDRRSLADRQRRLDARVRTFRSGVRPTPNDPPRNATVSMANGDQSSRSTVQDDIAAEARQLSARDTSSLSTDERGYVAMVQRLDHLLS